jgi:pilus assembly protein TadC
MLWTIGVAIFIAMFLFTYGLTLSLSSWRRVKVRAGELGSMGETSLLSPRGKPSIFKSWSLEWLAYSGAWALPNMNKVSEMRKSLILAGYRHPKAPAVYFGLRIVTAFALTFGLLLYFVVRESTAPINVLMAFCVGIGGFHLPANILRIKMNGRQERLDKALPDILDMFVISMDAGLSLNAALHRVADETRGVFHEFYEELQITAAELRTGINWDEAFDNLAQRTGVQRLAPSRGIYPHPTALEG